MSFVWISRWLLLASLTLYVAGLLIGMALPGFAPGLLYAGPYLSIAIGFSALLCVIAQVSHLISKRKKGLSDG